MEIENQAELKQLNTFGIACTAQRLVRISTPRELDNYFEARNPKPALVLGGGSNVLLTGPIDGTVMRMEIGGIEAVEERDDSVYLKAGAGVVWHQLVLRSLELNLCGIENLSLIPGSVGAAPMQNIGAYGVELKNVFHQLTAYLHHEKRWAHFNADECRFGYRESIFKRELAGKAIITSVTLKLSKHHSLHTSYGSIGDELEKMGIKTPTIHDVSAAVMRIRRSKLPDPAELGNAGSFFKNPVVPQEQFDSIKSTYSDAVGHPAGPGHVKMAAGWLIEKAGLKGIRRGSCGVHSKQALVLVNHGGATGNEVLQLSIEVIETVAAQFGVRLEREVNVV